MKKNETTKEIKLPQDLCFAGTYSCENCYYGSGSWRGNEMYCNKYGEYYYPSAANDCNAYYAK
ncbi:hypothetical protein [Butyrivibrio sp. AE2032]|uniref:hypothetical protein n=1 Tax=Butyrivibrio sp. AE2032 TaxID=1458463 RepID=UPI000553EA2A|nr:hypothetical protein [Butyrivibrio sp. AE2032]